jgi:hypothetical protein
MGFRVSAPAPDSGYNRTTDWPTAGTNTAAKARKGGFATMLGLKSTIAPPAGGAAAWHPTVAWMLGFVVVELALFHLLSRYLNI